MISMNDPASRTINDSIKLITPGLALPEQVVSPNDSNNLERMPKLDEFSKA